MTEKEAKEVGFKFVKEYDHDQFTTFQYKKGVIELEFTYIGQKLETSDITIDEVNCLPITFSELKQLDKILND